ncbi:hypothetical protein [Sinimarinibacterium sp. NLF-5-8]|uniref:spermine/spermidine synthase domain-containing protein n=1 Tax=Sinimarinibacterium sp. NLF-5-8 TaxID=2698684 RepID=UPI00137BBCC4|nr:hypothetical protein [Sinimarinibacterium sp. NLF-5-8]QHS10699.1 hypothetical protein GT972_11490 [Sinimarinibacterium sp. NLF-5-8]
MTGLKKTQNRVIQWLELPGKILDQDGVIRVRAGDETQDFIALLDALQTGQFNDPYIVDDGESRLLFFDQNSIQSEMDIAEPHILTLEYTQLMMAFLLFLPNPQQIALVGLGGGSLTRFCYHYLPGARITTLELSQDVIDLGQWFALPDDPARCRLIHTDAAAYFAQTDEQFDVVMVDGCDRYGTAEVFCTTEFYNHLHARMRANSVVVINLVGDENRIRRLLEAVIPVFGPRAVSLDTKAGNHILFILGTAVELDWNEIRRRGKKLETETELPFVRYAKRFYKNLM